LEPIAALAQRRTGELMHLLGRIGAVDVRILVDGGAVPSVIRESIVKKMGLEDFIQQTGYAGSTASGNIMQMREQITLEVEFLNGQPLSKPLMQAYEIISDQLTEPKEKKRKIMPTGTEAKVNGNRVLITFQVASQLAPEAILGMRDMEALKVVTSMENKKFICGGKCYELIEDKQQIYSIEEIMIPPHTGRMIKLVTSDRKASKNLLITMLDQEDKLGKRGPILVRSENGIIRIPLENMGDHPIQIPANSLVAMITEELEEEKLDNVGLIKVGNGVSRQIRRQIIRLIKTKQQVFGLKLYQHTKVAKGKVTITLIPNAKVQNGRIPYYPPGHAKLLKDAVKDLMDRGLVKKGWSPWLAPMMVVPKPDGGWRTVIDYRGLNSQTLPDSYPMPLIEEIINRLQGAKVFSKMDLVEGFWHLLLEEESKKYCAFGIRGEGVFIPERMPMGIKNGPANFQRMMDEVFGPLQEFCQPYIDDIIIFNKTPEEHVKHIEIVLNKL
jgi:hypothetical protein